MSSFRRQEQLLEEEAGNNPNPTAMAGIHNGLEESTVSTSKSTNILYYIGPALLAGIIVKAFDTAFLATSYSRLASDLQHFKDAAWVMLTDSLCSSLLVPLYIILLKSVGPRRTMFIAYGSFAFGLALSALSMSFWQFLSSRFVVGIGSSGITVLQLITINEIVGLKQLALWESLITCIEMTTSMAAGPLGAWVYRRFSWHSVFYLEVSAAILGLGLVYFAFAKVRSIPQFLGSPLLKKGNPEVPRVDVEGWLLLIIAITPPFIALSLGDNALGWTNPLQILLLVSGPVFLTGFVIYEAHIAVDPIIDMTPFFSLRYTGVLMEVFGVFFIFNAIAFVIPPYIQVRAFEQHSSFEYWALTFVLSGVPTGAIFGGYLIKTDMFSVRRIMLANAILLELACLLFVTRVIKPEQAQYSPLLIGFGFCIGIWQSSLLFATLSSTHKHWWPQTLATYFLVQMIGGNMGMASMSSIMRSIAKQGIRSGLGRSAATEKIISEAMRDLENIKMLDDGPRKLVLAAFEHAIHSSFSLPCGMAAAVIFIAIGLNVFKSQPEYEEIQEEDQRDDNEI